jgi:hypothetical protein
LAITSESFISLSEDDAAILSQNVYLTDVNSIFFDMKLETNRVGTDWTNVKRHAIVKIDEEVVWDSSVLGSGDLRGEYIDDPNLAVSADAIDPYRDGELHALSFGMVVNQSGSTDTVRHSL